MRSPLRTVSFVPFLLFACGDEEAAPDPDPVAVSQTVPRPVTEIDPFEFSRNLEVDSETVLDALVFEVVGEGTLDSISSLQVLARGQGFVVSITEAFDATFTEGSLRERVPAVTPLVVEDLDGLGADDDFDADFQVNGEDNCPQVQNTTQDDEDGDGVGAACDPDDSDPTVGPEGDRAGYPDIELQFRVFGYPEVVPEGGLELMIELLGRGLTLDL